MIRRLLPPTKLERDLAFQCVLSAFATGSFLTGTAVFFTQIVGLTGSQVGLGLSIAGAVTLALSLPLGRLADRVGAKQVWSLASLVEALLYFGWPSSRGMLTFVLLLSVTAAASVAGNTGRNVYRIAIFPRGAARVRALAYMRAARNVGYTLGALASGIALAIGTRPVIMAVPVLTGVLLLVNSAMVAALPPVARPEVGRPQDADEPAAPPAWRNTGFVVLSACNGVLSSNQVLLNVVVPLWLVERTDAPHILLAWLFGTNTVLAVLLQVRASRGAETVPGALRAVRRAAVAFVLSCLVISITHDTVGWISIVLIWVGHVTITGAELWQSASDWGFQSELSDHRRLGDYQGVWSLGYQAEPILFPGLFTFLALHWGPPGWALIAGLAVTAAVVAHPAAHRAQRYLVGVGGTPVPGSGPGSGPDPELPADGLVVPGSGHDQA